MVSSLSLLSSLVICLGVCHGSDVAQLPPCQTAGLKYLRGDAITGSTSCLGPDNQPYPINSVGRVYSGQTRKGRSSKLVDPIETQKTLLKYYAAANYGQEVSHQRNSYRQNRNLMPDNFPDTESRMRPASESSSRYGGCSGPGGRLCKTRYNTTAPLYGVSLTSGQPVTIVQKFPDLLQQVIYEVCDSSECDVIQGECVQTYVPYLFLVIPLGPVTLTGQDYVLVENGCICRPKYATTTNSQESIIADTLPGF